MWFFSAAFLTLLHLSFGGESSNVTDVCPGIDGFSKIVCYYEGRRDEKEVGVCGCTHVVYTGDIRSERLQDVAKEIKRRQPQVQFILRSTSNDSMDDLKKLMETPGYDGVELYQTHELLDRSRVLKRVGDVKETLRTNSTLMVSLPSQSELLAKYYDMKALHKYADLFILETHNLKDVHMVTYHPSRLSGLWDMLNIDSIVDLVTGLGVQEDKLVTLSPVNAYLFPLTNSSLNTPDSPTSDQPKVLNQKEFCETIQEGNWTLERYEDLSSPYTFQDSKWIAFEDETSLDVKTKYTRIRNLAGHGLVSIDDDFETPCAQNLLDSMVKSLNSNKRAPRQAILTSLKNEILSPPQRGFLPNSIQLSPYRITKVVDSDGIIHPVREDIRTEFECQRQGYYVHPRTCNRFYRCVKFDQLSDEFTVFEFDCPAGLAFDSRYEVCVWPGSLDASQACPGSSEIAPVPQTRFICPAVEGYYADPENCRWFFACLNHGKDVLTAYEFRCPFGLGFDESRGICDWPWQIPACGDIGKYEYSLHNHGQGHNGVIVNGPTPFIGNTADDLNIAGFESIKSGAQYDNSIGLLHLQPKSNFPVVKEELPTIVNADNNNQASFQDNINYNLNLEIARNRDNKNLNVYNNQDQSFNQLYTSQGNPDNTLNYIKLSNAAGVAQNIQYYSPNSEEYESTNGNIHAYRQPKLSQNYNQIFSSGESTLDTLPQIKYTQDNLQSYNQQIDQSNSYLNNLDHSKYYYAPSKKDYAVPATAQSTISTSLNNANTKYYTKTDETNYNPSLPSPQPILLQNQYPVSQTIDLTKYFQEPNKINPIPLQYSTPYPTQPSSKLESEAIKSVNDETNKIKLNTYLLDLTKNNNQNVENVQEPFHDQNGEINYSALLTDITSRFPNLQHVDLAKYYYAPNKINITRLYSDLPYFIQQSPSYTQQIQKQGTTKYLVEPKQVNYNFVPNDLTQSVQYLQKNVPGLEDFQMTKYYDETNQVNYNLLLTDLMQRFPVLQTVDLKKYYESNAINLNSFFADLPYLIENPAPQIPVVNNAEFTKYTNELNPQNYNVFLSNSPKTLNLDIPNIKYYAANEQSYDSPQRQDPNLIYTSNARSQISQNFDTKKYNIAQHPINYTTYYQDTYNFETQQPYDQNVFVTEKLYTDGKIAQFSNTSPKTFNSEFYSKTSQYTSTDEPTKAFYTSAPQYSISTQKPIQTDSYIQIAQYSNTEKPSDTYYNAPAAQYTFNENPSEKYYNLQKTQYTNTEKSTETYYNAQTVQYTNNQQPSESYYNAPSADYTNNENAHAIYYNVQGSQYTNTEKHGAAYYNVPTASYTNNQKSSEGYYNVPTASYTNNEKTSEGYYNVPTASYTNNEKPSERYYNSQKSQYTNTENPAKTYYNIQTVKFTSTANPIKSYYNEQTPKYAVTTEQPIRQNYFDETIQYATSTQKSIEDNSYLQTYQYTKNNDEFNKPNDFIKTAQYSANIDQDNKPNIYIQTQYASTTTQKPDSINYSIKYPAPTQSSEKNKNIYVTKVMDTYPSIIKKWKSQCGLIYLLKWKSKSAQTGEDNSEYDIRIEGTEDYEDGVSKSEENSYSEGIDIIQKPKITLTSKVNPIVVKDFDENDDSKLEVSTEKTVKIEPPKYKNELNRLSQKEQQSGRIECKREGLFRHPNNCNKFYSCDWDTFKNKYILHEFKCPIQLNFDQNMGGCNWPSQGPACQSDTLLPSL